MLGKNLMLSISIILMTNPQMLLIPAWKDSPKCSPKITSAWWLSQEQKDQMSIIHKLELCWVNNNWKEEECLSWFLEKLCHLLFHMIPTLGHQDISRIDFWQDLDSKTFISIVWQGVKVSLIQLSKHQEAGIFKDAWWNIFNLWKLNTTILWEIATEVLCSSFMEKIHWIQPRKNSLRN